jgi:peptide/nickel transport system permease protein
MAEKNKLYAISLESQGLSSTRFFKKQLVKNALFPIVTQLAAIFPALITGSLIIEVLFNIPGMGRLLYDSILANDWPIVFPIVLLAGLFTIMGYFISDLLYLKIDPRIKPEEM